MGQQLTELLTQYGPIAEIWFDGACGEGPNGKKQVYAWDEYYQLIRNLQPGTIIANAGPDVRWVGNEHGIARKDEWSEVPIAHQDPAKVAEGSQQSENHKLAIKETSRDLGGRDKILTAGDLAWYPAECDVSIRPGWFYHRWQDWLVKSPRKLVDLYFKSVGRNSFLLLNLPPDPRGVIHERDVKNLKGMRQTLDQTFARNLMVASRATANHAKEGFPIEHILDNDPNTYWTTDDWQETAAIDIELNALQTFNIILLQEHIPVGQRIEKIHIDAWNGRQWQTIARGGTVGYKRILRCRSTQTNRIRLVIEGSRFAPTLSDIGLYNWDDKRVW